MRLRALLTGVIAGAMLAAAPAQAEAPAEAPAEKAGYVVVLKTTPSWESAQALAERYHGHLEQAFLTALPGFSARMTSADAARLAADPAVASVQPDQRVRLADAQLDPPSWGLDRVDRPTHELNGAYTYGEDAGNVTVYVIDSGVRTSHDDFGGRATSGWDFVDDDADADDCSGHGTHVAGTIGGTKYGVAKNAQLVALRAVDCAGNGSYSDIIAAVDWVTANAHRPAVVNMSFGGAAYAPLNEAITASVASGVTYVVSAGNDNADACAFSPAGTAAAITVGATGRNDARAPFSNAGPCVDLFAPGVGITSAGIADDSAATVMSGTSMAAPHVAGAAALVLAADPEASPAEVAAALGAGAASGAVSDPAGAPDLLVQTPAAPCSVRSSGAVVGVKDRGTRVSAIGLTECPGRVAWASVEVHISHPRRGDLVIDLVAPNGRVKRLKTSDRRDKGADVNAVYSVALNVKHRAGTWKLRVRDTTRGATGQVDSWTLTLA